ncbi:hypothetical protein GUITHDRAFT_142556 [Guillardia theta CCMP2712]|uniref:EF-hand domain-containing protein n=1 Tax=Guillardia theta (strain CCMP2712) TaxID=905079 RepID=L1IX44_GUITC|nr:hypothetical protein GUITHDRAFT_142556 [Guillardia theta CCMP2712]EKX40682.1 hypothetical protein GUITHDRAFT_142556 [Guillardia theta CCMP2712]|eukprot:XP_005827662.1 hypothetical protein GUITHDRAFT_142556 [Guillardia theta CCMP2712]
MPGARRERTSTGRTNGQKMTTTLEGKREEAEKRESRPRAKSVLEGRMAGVVQAELSVKEGREERAGTRRSRSHATELAEEQKSQSHVMPGWNKWRQGGLRDCVKAAKACDSRGEGLLGIEELKKMATMMGASSREAQLLLDSCPSIELPGTGKRVVTYQSLFRYLWPNSARAGSEDAGNARREPKYLFNPHLKSGILNDVRETTLDEIGEKRSCEVF